MISLPAATIVAFGDSTTAPRGSISVYADILENKLTKNGSPVEVINAGVPSNTTRDARARFEEDVLSHNPDVIIIQFGINDAAIDVWKTPPVKESRVALKEYVANLRQFTNAARARGIRVVLMTPNKLRWTPDLVGLYGKPPYDVADKDGLNFMLRSYAAAMQGLAQELDIELVDIFGSLEAQEKGGSSLDDLLLDGIHPNQAGHRHVARLLLSHFQKSPILVSGLEH